MRVADLVRQRCVGDPPEPLHQARHVEVRRRPERELNTLCGRFPAIDSEPGRVRTAVAQRAEHARKQRAEAGF